MPPHWSREPEVLPPRELEGLDLEPSHIRWHMEWQAHCPFREADEKRWVGWDKHALRDAHPVVVVPLWSVLRALHRRVGVLDGEWYKRMNEAIGMHLPAELVREIARFDADASIAPVHHQPNKKRKDCN